jgi:glutaredoxin-like protein
MPLIDERDQAEIRKILGAMKNRVKLVNFTQTFECETSHDTRQLLEELAPLSDKLELETHNFITDKEKVEPFHIDKIPAIALVGDKDRGIRYYGIPAGFEFASLLEDLIMVSNGDSGLQPRTREKLATLTKPVHLQVMVTPT